MATGPSDVRQITEGDETSEESAGKKKSKFQTFKKFFAKKKRKEPPAPIRDSNLKPSQSSSDVSMSEPTVVSPSTSELGAKGSMGSKALSHESVFISEPVSENVTGKRLSQENLPGNVKTLQLQLESNIRIGSPPQVITSKTSDDAGAVSEDDGLPQSPPEMSTLHEILTRSPSKSFKPVEHRSSLSLGGTDSEEEQALLQHQQVPHQPLPQRGQEAHVSSASSSRPISPLSSAVLGIATSASPVSSLPPVDFSTPVSTLGCLDNSAARHKIALNPRKHRDHVKRSKLTAEPHPAKEQLSRLSEEETSTVQLLATAQHDLNSEGSEVQEEVTKIPGVVDDIEKTDVTEHPEHASQPSTEVADNDVMLKKALEESDLCFTNIVTVTSPNVFNVQCKQQEDIVDQGEVEEVKIAYCPSGDSPSESEIRRHSAVSGIVELSETPEKLTETTKCQDETDVASVVLNHASEQKEYINIMTTTDTRDYLLEQADEAESKLLVGTVHSVANVLLPLANESSLITPETILSVNVEQFQLPTLRPSPEVERTYKCESAQQFISETTTETGEGQDTSPEETQQLENNEEPQNRLQKCSDVDGLDLNTLLIQQSSDKPYSFKVEKCIEDTLTKTLDESDISSVDYINKWSANDPDADHITVNNAVKDQMAKTSSKTKKATGAAYEIVKSQQKSTTKPVRFTIAPAWQRSLSGGSNTKEETIVGNITPSTIKCELFEGTTEDPAHIDVVKPQSKVSFSHDDNSGNAGMPHSHTKNCQSGTQDIEIPFGVRLKRASPFLKHSDEKSSNFQRPDPCSMQTSPLVKDLHKPDSTGKSPHSTGKSPQVTSRITKPSTKQPDLLEEKHLQNTRPKEVPKKPYTSKSIETSTNKSLATVTSEPEWISMAKSKRKGFQGHPLAREQSTPEKVVIGIDTEEVVSCASEDGLRRGFVISHIDEENTSQPYVSTTPAAVIGHGSLETSQPPISEKGAGQTANLPATQQNPDEPPWLSLAKKKAKAWSEMPQIVQ